MSLRRAMDAARDAELTLDIRGAGRVIAQDPLPGKAPGNTKVLLRFSDEDPRIMRDDAPSP
jgi:hypothetical protein